MAVRRFVLTPFYAATLPDTCEIARFRVMWRVEKRPGISQRKITNALGILQALFGRGLMKVANFRNANNKLRYAYLRTTEAIASRSVQTANLLRAKRLEYDTLQAEMKVLRADLNRSDLQDGLCG